jgi:predicted  nucleic acid-binding Zn-ribbon protein
MARLRIPLDTICVKTGILCPSCQRKVDEGEVQEFEVEILRNLLELENEIKEANARINDLQQKRRHYEEGIDKKILERYNYLLENRHGLAIVSLKNGTCGGCFMDLPAEVINRIKQYKDIVFCEMCARILYLEEDFEL